MSNTGLSQRMAKFNQAFKNILGPKRQGYTEAGTLEQPLVSSHAQSDDEYYREHGVSRPGAAPPAQQQQQQFRPQGPAETEMLPRWTCSEAKGVILRAE